MSSLRDVIDATLAGRDERLVARCSIQGILSAFDQYGIYDVNDLSANLETAFGAVQAQVGDAAPPSFLGLLQAHLRSSSTQQPSTAIPATPARALPPDVP